MDVSACPGCRERDARIAILEQRVSVLEARIEELLRAGKRQAAPFAKQPSHKKPKKPGRKPGPDYGTKAHRLPPAPEQIDETHEAPLPEDCPDCGGAIDETDLACQYQVEIPRQPIYRRFHIHIGHCRNCGRRVQGRNPLQTSDALGAAAAQLGPDAQAAVVELNKQAGLSHGKVARCLASLFGIRLSRGGVAHTLLRAACRSAPFYCMLRDAVGEGGWVVLDETGWRVGGRSAWLHGLVGRDATVYVIAPTRSGAVAQNIIGSDYAGVMIHDGWSPYDGFLSAGHQQCLAHLLRRCRDMLETSTREAAHFPRRVAAILQTALAMRDRHAAGDVSAHGLAVVRGRLQRRLADLLSQPQTDPANERLARHLRKHLDQMFWFLWLPGLDATNWRAEHAMRFGVILRKVWGGNRTWRGAQTQAVLMSVWRTCAQHSRSALDFLSHWLRLSPSLLALPP
jgi:transposase